MATTIEILEAAITEKSKKVNRVLVLGSSCIGLIVLLKIMGESSFTWQNVKFSTSSSWLVLLLFTIGHFYTAWVLIKSCYRLWETGDQKSMNQAFELVTSKGGIFFSGLTSRTEYIEITPVSRFYNMKIDDPTTWLHTGAAILILLSIVPFDISNLIRSLFLFVVGLVLTYTNWIIESLGYFFIRVNA